MLFWVREDFKPAVRTKHRSFLDDFRVLLRAPNMISLYAVTFLQTIGRMLFFPIAALFIMDLMGTAARVATVTGLMMGAKAVMGSISAIWLGRLGDRSGHGKILLVASLAALCFYLPQAFVAKAWQLLLLQAFCGLANGGMIPSLGALMNLRSPVGSQGATYGLNASITAAGRSLAPMMGAGIAIWLGMRSVFILAAVVYGLAALVVLHIRRVEPQ